MEAGLLCFLRVLIICHSSQVHKFTNLLSVYSIHLIVAFICVESLPHYRQCTDNWQCDKNPTFIHVLIPGFYFQSECMLAFLHIQAGCMYVLFNMQTGLISLHVNSIFENSRYFNSHIQMNCFTNKCLVLLHLTE